MPDYHDIFWKLILLRMDCAIEFFRFLLKEKAEFLDLENIVSIQDVYYRKKKLLYDILYEIPILFYQGLDNWDPEWELAEERKLSNPILSENRQEILNSLEEPKRIDLEEDMLDYIFRSRLESRELVEEVIMGKQRTMTLYERALEEGEFRNKLDTARKMSEEKFNREQIIRITGLSELELRENGVI